MLRKTNGVWFANGLAAWIIGTRHTISPQFSSC